MEKTTAMVSVPAGDFWMGSDLGYPDEAPVHLRRASAILLDVSPVTNAQFSRFVEATGHVTIAERTRAWSAAPLDLCARCQLARPRGARQRHR
jgi:formylglycine-generating enzyme required for sulfatase activity